MCTWASATPGFRLSAFHSFVLPKWMPKLTFIAAVWKVKPEVLVWRETSHRLKILGVPVGHPEHVVRELAQKAKEHSLLYERIPLVEDVQAAWLLLTFCAATRPIFGCALFFEFTQDCAEVHDRSVTSRSSTCTTSPSIFGSRLPRH